MKRERKEVAASFKGRETMPQWAGISAAIGWRGRRTLRNIVWSQEAPQQDLEVPCTPLWLGVCTLIPWVGSLSAGNGTVRGLWTLQILVQAWSSFILETERNSGSTQYQVDPGGG